MNAASPTEPTADRLEVMNFLNEVAGRFPAAISFASGRPAEQFFRVEEWMRAIELFVADSATRGSLDLTTARNLLAQYGKTNGVIQALIAEQIGVDEGISCDGERVVVTAGCQEAIALCVAAVCRSKDDIVLVRTPTYIGITGVADLTGVPLAPIVCERSEDLPIAIEAEARRLRSIGKRPRAFYVIPDFDNPTGTVLGLETRHRLLATCAAEGILVLEDNPYGMFCYEGERLPPLAAIDTHGCTLYLGTYSKTLCPSVRVGFIVVPKHLLGSPEDAHRFIGRLAVTKSFLTCNTSQLMQALVGGVLLSEKGSLRNIVQPALAHYRANLRRMIEALKATLGGIDERVRWNQPRGGFFLRVDLPFRFREAEVAICAEAYKVIAMPMSFFALTRDHDRSVRLAFSNVSADQIDAGVERFAAFVKSRL